MADTYLLACGVRCKGGVDSLSGSRTELENPAGDGKGKRHKRKNREVESTKARAGADCFVVAEKRVMPRGAMCQEDANSVMLCER